MSAVTTPGTDPAYEGRNKYGEGAKDKLQDSDHAASDADLNVQGDDQPHRHPGAAHEESAPHQDGDHSTNYKINPEEEGEKQTIPVRTVTTSEHDAPSTIIPI